MHSSQGQELLWGSVRLIHHHPLSLDPKSSSLSQNAAYCLATGEGSQDACSSTLDIHAGRRALSQPGGELRPGGSLTAVSSPKRARVYRLPGLSVRVAVTYTGPPGHRTPHQGKEVATKARSNKLGRRESWGRHDPPGPTQITSTPSSFRSETFEDASFRSQNKTTFLNQRTLVKCDPDSVSTLLMTSAVSGSTQFCPLCLCARRGARAHSRGVRRALI